MPSKVSGASIARSILALVFFLTIIPSRKRWSIEDAAKGFYLIPVASFIRSMIIVVPAAFAMLCSGPLLFALTLLSLYVFISRGLHIDGLADYLDAVGSLKKGEDALKVMKDPRKGSFAVLAVSLYVATFIICMRSIASSLSNVVELLGVTSSIFMWSDEAMFLLATMSTPAPYGGLGRLFVERSKDNVKCVVNAVLVSVMTVLLYALSGYVSLLPSVCSIVTALLIHLDASKRLGFVNGDILGASNEISKIVSMIVITGVLGAA